MKEITLADGRKVRFSIEASPPVAGEVKFTAKITDRGGNALPDEGDHSVSFSLDGSLPYADEQSFQDGLAQVVRPLATGDHEMVAMLDNTPGWTEKVRAPIKGATRKDPDHYQLLIRGPHGKKSFDLNVTSGKGPCVGAKGHIAIIQDPKKAPRLEFTTDTSGLALVPQDGKPFEYDRELSGVVVIGGLEERVKQVPFRLPPPGPMGWRSSPEYESKSRLGKFRERLAHRNNTRANVFFVFGALWFVLNCIFVGTGAVEHGTPSAVVAPVGGHVLSYAEEAREALKNRSRPGKPSAGKEPKSAVPPPTSTPEPKAIIPDVAHAHEANIYVSWQLNLFFLLIFCPLYWLASWREEIAYVFRETRYWRSQTEVVTGAEDGQVAIATDMPKNRSGFIQYLQQSMPSVAPFWMLLVVELIAEGIGEIGEKLLLHWRGKEKPAAQQA